ncbi:hypothetical protein LEA_19687, partial [human gut metagenome]
LCYGAQLMMHVLGGKVEKAPVREYGKTEVMVDTTSPLFGLLMLMHIQGDSTSKSPFPPDLPQATRNNVYRR